MTEPLSSGPPPPPTVPAQRFEMLARIGAGNHGVVFRARDHQMHRDVAIKRFSHVLVDDPRAMHRITREVATMARVSHPNVVTVHDLVDLPDGDGEVTPHLVMELVEGTSLRDLLATRGPSRRSVRVVRAVLDGLQACHRAGVLHLDIKPANVLVTPSAGVKIVDFGIARAASDATATIAGTPHYMPPEQYDGRADERSDVYSVGCLLYECLTGRPPFAGSVAAQLTAHRSEPRPDPRAVDPAIDPRLAAVVVRAMAIRPEDRYPGVAALREALDAAEHAAPSPAPPRLVPVRPVAGPEPVRTGPGTVTRWSRLGTLGAGLAVSAFVVALVPGLVWTSTLLGPAADHRPPTFDDTGATLWWLVAVGVAASFLLVRRDQVIARLGGPAVGQPRPAAVLGPHTRAGVRLAAAGALRGSVPMLFPWYVAAVSGLAAATGVAWPADPYESVWTVAWLLMPLASVGLALRGAANLRPRAGGAAAPQFAAAAAAAVLFVAYRTVV